MNLRDLKYFISVVEFKHFGQAAEKNHASQPALSMQIKKLEEELNVQLFERSRKQAMVTDIGNEIAVSAHKILREENKIKQLAESAQDPFCGRRALGAFPTLSSYIFPKIMPEISQQLPNLTIFLLEEKTSALIELILQGTLDAALVALPIQHFDLDAIPLFRENFFLAVSKQHAWASKRSITLNELSAEKLLLLDEGHCLRDHALEVCARSNSEPEQMVRATSLETLREMVAMNIGITLIPEIAVRENTHIAYIPFSDPSPYRETGIIFRETAARKYCVQAISKIIHQIMV